MKLFTWNGIINLLLQFSIKIYYNLIILVKILKLLKNMLSKIFDDFFYIIFCLLLKSIVLLHYSLA